MVLMETPVCHFGEKAHDFNLPGIDEKKWSLKDSAGEKGTLIMFICNHCPYVKAIRSRLVEEASALEKIGVNSVAIMSNDPTDYPEDSFQNMQKIAAEFHYPFPYLLDESQEVAKTYGAICTPDFFGYNSDLELQYRGRLDDGSLEPGDKDLKRELFMAMVQVAETGRGPERQIPGMGCSIKWKKDGG